MSFNREKILARAQKFLQKGQNQKAVEEYEKILEIDPKDVRILQKVGDLYAKVGNIETATEYFRKVAEFYAADGFFLKAVAVYKQISKLDPGIIKVYLRLAELYNQLSLNSEAMKQYQIVMKHYEKKGMKKEYLDVVKKLADLDPENIVNRMRLAELYSKEGRDKEAVAEYKQIALEQKEKGNLEDLSKIYESILAINKDDKALALELSATYLKIGEPKKALAKLQVCFQNDPKNTETLNLLAKAFWDLQQPEKARSVYQELINIYQENGLEEERAEVEHKMNELFNLSEKNAAEAQSPLLEGDDLIDVGSDLDLGAIEEAASFSETHAEDVDEMAVESASPTDNTITEKLLSEVEVYLKYGLIDKAVDNVVEVLQINPADETALELFKQVVAQVSETGPLLRRVEHLIESVGEDGANQLISLKEFLENKDDADQSVAETLAAEPAAAEPEIATAEEPAQEPAPAAKESSDEGIEVDLDNIDDISIDLSELEEEKVAESAPKAAQETSELPAENLDISFSELDDVAADSPAVKEATAAKETVEKEEKPFELDFAEEEGELQMEREEAVAEETELPASPGLRRGRPEEEDEFAAETVLAEEDEIAETADDSDQQPEGKADIIDLKKELREKFKNDMEEAEFFVTQALFGEATSIYQAILKKDSSYEPAKLKLQEIERAKAAAAGKAEATPAKEKKKPEKAKTPAAVKETKELIAKEAKEEGDFFDLAGALADEIEALEEEEVAPESKEEAPSFDEVFSKFKEGVKDTVKETDYQTHYDLGIAYKEMGLFDDAIAEFALTSKDKTKEKACSSMIAICYYAKGDYQRAILLYEKCLGSSGLRAEEILGIKYELAAARQANGEAKKALQLYKEIAENSPSFREVKSKIKGLLSGKGEAEESEEGKAQGKKSNKISYI